MLQTASGGLSEISSSLGRMRELAVQAGNGTLAPEDRATLNNEFQELKSQIDSMAQTEYNGTALLDNGASHDIQIGRRRGVLHCAMLHRIDSAQGFSLATSFCHVGRIV